MNAKTSLIAATLALLLGSAGALAHDGVAASFERMLTDDRSGVAAVSAPPADGDPLVEAMVVPLRDGVPRRHAQADPVLESFQRMLTHTPNWTAPLAPSGFGPDPLAAALVEPLREWLAQAALSSRLASGQASTWQR